MMSIFSLIASDCLNSKKLFFSFLLNEGINFLVYRCSVIFLRATSLKRITRKNLRVYRVFKGVIDL